MMALILPHYYLSGDNSASVLLVRDASFFIGHFSDHFW